MYMLGPIPLFRRRIIYFKVFKVKFVFLDLMKSQFGFAIAIFFLSNLTPDINTQRARPQQKPFNSTDPVNQSIEKKERKTAHHR